MKRMANMARLPAAGILLMLLGMPLAPAPVFAADAPAVAGTAEMSREVATRLNAVIALMDAGDFEAAATAMQMLRADLQESMTEYEESVTLQTSASLNTTLFKYAEAIADYEALLAMNTLAAADRLATANFTGQLYLQLGDWNKGLEHLLAVNAMQGGNDMETLFRIAFAHSQLGQSAAAVPYMEQALAAGGERAPEDYYRNMATLYMQTQDPAKAITTYEKLLEVSPDIADRERVSANMAALYIQLGDKVKASSLLRTLIREYPMSDQLPVWRQSLTALTGQP